jgi:hypothetical protein
MDLSSNWYIDGIDIWLAYNMAISEGSANLLRFPQKKESLSHNWSDANGKDYDLSEIFFDERISTLKMYVLDVDEDAFWIKYNAFISKLSEPYLHRLSLKSHGARNYYFFYKECSSYQQNISLKGIPDNVIAHTFNITIVEPNPNPLGDVTEFIIDEESRFLIT